MSLPAVRAVREAFPRARLTLLIQERWIPLLEGHPDIDHLWPLGPQKDQGWGATLRWGRQLRKGRFDAALLLNPTRTFHVATLLAGIPIRAGYRRKWGFCLTHRIQDTKALRDLHESDYNLELARLLGAKAEKKELLLPICKEALAQAGALLESEGICAAKRPIALHPWTSNPDKSWPLEAFGQLARRLGRSGHPVLLIGEPNPSTGWQKVAPPGGGTFLDESSGVAANGMTNLVRKVPLRLLPAVLASCGVLVSNDSGPAHVAAAVGTPTVVVAPRSHEKALRRWRPLGPHVRILLSPDPAAAEYTVMRCLKEHVRDCRHPGV